MNFDSDSSFSMTIVKSASDSGGFTAIASTADLDRDNEIIEVGAFSPLPAQIPVHLGHPYPRGTEAKLAGSARPYYDSHKLMLDGRFAPNAHGKEARELVLGGFLNSMSVMFHKPERVRGTDGVTRIVKGELIACDFVTIPANRSALVLSARHYQPPMSWQRARALASLTLAQATLTLTAPRTPQQQAEQILRDAERTLRGR